MEEIKEVYVTSSGEKYHIDKKCQYIRKYKTKKISLIQAQKNNKLPCKGCSIDNNDIKNNKIFNNKYKYNNKKNFQKKIDNNIESEDANDTIFNESLFKEKNNNIKEKDIDIDIDDKKENIKKKINNEGFEIEKENDIDFNKYQKKYENDDITDSHMFITNSSRGSSYIESESSDEDIERVNTINDSSEKDKNTEYKYNNKIDNMKSDILINNKIRSNTNYKSKEDKKNNYKNNYNNIDEIKKQDIINNVKNENYINENNNYSPFNYKMEIIQNNDIDDSNLYLKKSNSQECEKNMSFLYYQIMNNLNNFNKNNYICQKNDMNILELTYKDATLLSLNKGNLSINFNIQKIDNTLALKDSFMFKFEISNLNENDHKYLKIEVGFKLKYINSKDINFIEDERMININNMKYKIGSLYDSIKIKKNLMVLNSTGVVYVLINILNGKFFIIGKKELEKRQKNMILLRHNTEIFFVLNFIPILPQNLKSIRPSFNFSKNNLKYFEIKVNEEIMNE